MLVLLAFSDRPGKESIIWGQNTFSKSQQFQVAHKKKCLLFYMEFLAFQIWHLVGLSNMYWIQFILPGIQSLSTSFASDSKEVQSSELITRTSELFWWNQNLWNLIHDFLEILFLLCKTYKKYMNIVFTQQSYLICSCMWAFSRLQSQLWTIPNVCNFKK